MNRKIVTLILVALVSLCFIGIVMAENATNDAGNGTDDGPSGDQDQSDDTPDKDDATDKDDNKDKDKDKNKSSDKDKTDDKSKKNYILAKGHGNDIKFSDGSRGFRLDYSKSPASKGDDFKHISASKAPNANTLKLAVVECYRHDMDNSIGSILTDFIKSGSSNTKVGKAVASSSEKVGDTAVVMIDNKTEAVFEFQVLKSVSGNESNYFAYKVSFRSIDYEHILVPVNQTNETNETGPESFTNNTTLPTTVLNQTNDNETNSTFLDDLYGYFGSVLDSLYDAWKPIIDSITGFALSVIGGIEWIEDMFNGFMDQIQQLIDGFNRLIELLGSIWTELSGFLKLFAVLLSGIEQLLKLVLTALNFVIGLLQTIISLIQYIIGLIMSIINFVIGLINQIIGMISGLISSIIAFITDLLNQISALIDAILGLLKKVGSYLVDVIANAAIIICGFIVVTVATFVYGKSR